MRGRSGNSVVSKAEQVVRDYRLSQGEDEGGVTIPTWLFAGIIGVIIGGIFTPSIMAATEAGSRKLAELSRQYIEKR